jgi:integrase
MNGGVDPIWARQAARSAAAAERLAQRTFSELVAEYIAEHEKSWRNEKHSAQWTATLRTYAEPLIGNLFVKDVRPAHVIGVLKPIWTSKTETATRVRSRIELVLDYATAHGYREGLNPARWKGNLDAALPNASKVAPVRHHAPMRVADMPAFAKRLRQQEGMGARALEFAILTAARSGEVRGATWSEIDVGRALWTIPAARMKSGREHRVPLSEPALKLLRWVSGHTEHSGEVAEMALSHAIGDKVEAAYRRGDLLAKRVALMRDWAAYLVQATDANAMAS